jgi:hypothetical protein
MLSHARFARSGALADLHKAESDETRALAFERAAKLLEGRCRARITNQAADLAGAR